MLFFTRNSESPLMLLLGIFIWLIQAEAYQVHDDQTFEGWIPISKERTSRYLELSPINHEQDYEPRRQNPKIKVIDKDNMTEDWFKTTVINRKMKEKASQVIDNGNINQQLIFDYDIKSILEKVAKLNEAILTATALYGDQRIGREENTSVHGDVEIETKSKYSAAFRASIKSLLYMGFHISESSKSQAHPPPSEFTLQPEVTNDSPFIPYSNHATNKSDATAYYPRRNGYKETPARRLRHNNNNENTELNTGDFKSNHFNSGRTFKEEIGKRDANNGPLLKMKRFNNTKLSYSNRINTETDKNNTKRNIDTDYSNTRSFPLFEGINFLIRSNKPHFDISSQHADSNVYEKVLNANDLNGKLTEILSKYNISKHDKLDNYAESRRYRMDAKEENAGYFYDPPPQSPKGYNSLNHLPADPLTAVWLSNYGHYIPGYNGRNNHFRNIYGYLASNNIHNNKPFGSYKIYSDSNGA